MCKFLSPFILAVVFTGSPLLAEVADSISFGPGPGSLTMNGIPFGPGSGGMARLEIEPGSKINGFPLYKICRRGY